MRVANKYADPLRARASSIIAQANKGKRKAGPNFPPPRALPQRPKSSPAPKGRPRVR